MIAVLGTMAGAGKEAAISAGRRTDFATIADW
jgi:hypothetical protein